MFRVLRAGMSGNDVRELQKLLNTHVNAGLTTDGVFGSKTTEAVKAFQRQRKIQVDGIVGQQTWIALTAAPSAPPPPLPPPAESVLVQYGGQKVPFFKQFDAAWGTRKLGSSSSLKAAGCAITSVAMVLKYYGRDIDPGKLDEYLDNNGGYSGNSVKWDVAFKAGSSPGKASLQITNHAHRDKSQFTSVLNDRIARNVPTIAQVDYGSDTDTDGNHFVVIVGRTEAGAFVMNDPGSSSGDGTSNPAANIVTQVTRKDGYTMMRLVLFEAT